MKTSSSVMIILLISLSASAQSTSTINVCMNDQAITLDPSYTWSGPGVANNIFYPPVVGVGEYTLTGNNQDEKTIKIMVYPPPVVLFENILPTTTNTPPTELKTNLTGGTFEGKGVDGKYFYPAVAGVGTHLIQYVYQHPITKCTTIVVQYVVVSI